MKWLTDFIPFLTPYPIWVKVLVSGGVLFSAICIVALLIAHPQNSEQTWINILLTIKRVKICDSLWDDAGVRVTAKVNGNSLTYPKIGGAELVMVSPDMSPGSFE